MTPEQRETVAGFFPEGCVIFFKKPTSPPFGPGPYGVFTYNPEGFSVIDDVSEMVLSTFERKPKPRGDDCESGTCRP